MEAISNVWPSALFVTFYSCVLFDCQILKAGNVEHDIVSFFLAAFFPFTHSF